MSDVPTIGERIQALRKEAGLTQLELGKRVGKGVTRISDLERDRYRMPDTKTLSALAKALNVTLADLLSAPRTPQDPRIAEWPVFARLRSAVDQHRNEPDRYRMLVARYDTALARANAMMDALAELQSSLGLTEDVDVPIAVDRQSRAKRRAPSGRAAKDEKFFETWERLAPHVQDSMLNFLDAVSRRNAKRRA